MLSYFHNLLFFHGPTVHCNVDGDNNNGDGEGDLDKLEAGAFADIPEGLEDNLEDSLPQEYWYLCDLNYNQPRQPRCGDIVKYFDSNFNRGL